MLSKNRGERYEFGSTLELDFSPDVRPIPDSVKKNGVPVAKIRNRGSRLLFYTFQFICRNVATTNGVPMKITTLSSREFNQDTSRAKKAANKGPVFITDRGRTAHVLLTIEDYQRLTGDRMSLRQALEQSGKDIDFVFDPPQIESLLRPADLS